MCGNVGSLLINRQHCANPPLISDFTGDHDQDNDGNHDDLNTMIMTMIILTMNMSRTYFNVIFSALLPLFLMLALNLYIIHDLRNIKVLEDLILGVGNISIISRFKDLAPKIS